MRDNSLSKNIHILYSLGVIVSLPVYFFVLSSISDSLFNWQSDILTRLTYIIVIIYLIYIAIKYKIITANGIFIYTCILSTIVLFYLIFPYSRQYFLTIEMAIILILYLPFSVIFLRRVNDWSQSFIIWKKVAVFNVLVAAFSFAFLNISYFTDYMEFSYSLLPFIMILYISVRQEHSYNSLFMFSLGTLLLIAYSARAPILFLITFVFAYELTIPRKKISRKTIIQTLIIIFILLCLVTINSYLGFIELIVSKSRFFEKLFDGNLFVSSDRTILYEQANIELKKMGFKIYGPFIDRYLFNAVYVHNIFYEILLSFGFIFGTIILLFLFSVIVKSVVVTKGIYKTIALMLFFSLFARFIVSGSYLIEGRFYLYIFCIFSIIKSNRQLAEKRYHIEDKCNNSRVQC